MSAIISLCHRKTVTSKSTLLWKYSWLIADHQNNWFTLWVNCSYTEDSRIFSVVCRYTNLIFLRFDEAMDSIRREIGFHQEAGNIGQIGRLCVVGVLIQLARGDVVAAEKIYKVSCCRKSLSMRLKCKFCGHIQEITPRHSRRSMN